MRRITLCALPILIVLLYLCWRKDTEIPVLAPPIPEDPEAMAPYEVQWAATNLASEWARIDREAMARSMEKQGRAMGGKEEGR